MSWFSAVTLFAVFLFASRAAADPLQFPGVNDIPPPLPIGPPAGPSGLNGLPPPLPIGPPAAPSGLNGLPPPIPMGPPADPSGSSELPAPIPTETPEQMSSLAPVTSIIPVVEENQETTSGIVGSISSLFSPITKLLYQFIDSLLRNVFDEKLPCNIYSFIPLNVVCTPFVKDE